MPEIIEKVVSVAFLILGLSYFYQAKLWVGIATEIIEKPEKRLLLTLVFLPFGLIIVLGHNVWVSDWPVVITILGWLITVKCAFYLIVPQLAPKLAKLLANRSVNFLRNYISICGVVTTVLGALLVYQFFIK